MVQRDRQGLVVEPPQRLEHDLGLGAGVDEHQGGGVAADRRHDRGDRVRAHPPRPRQRLVGRQDRDLGRRTGRADDAPDRAVGPPGRRQVGLERVGEGDGRRQADAPQPRRQALEPRQVEGQEIAALGAGERVEFIENDHVERAEQGRRVVERGQEGERLGSRQQDVRRALALAAALVRRRVAGARLGAHRQRHLGDRRHQVALDVDRQRLERRDVERVELLGGLRGQRDQAGQEAGERLAAAGRRDQQRRAAGMRRLEEGELMGVGLPATPGEPVDEARR